MKASPPPDSESASSAKLWFQAACIFAAAVVLGVVYNGTSPLGLRPHQTNVAESVPAVPSVPRTGVFNETLSMTLETAQGSALPTSVANPAPATAAHQSIIPTRTWAQVKTMLEAGQIVLVDSRPKSAYDLGHIPGAVLLPSNAPLTELQAFAAKYPKDTVIVVYCNSTTCRSSQQLAHQLLTLGRFTNVSEMPGGYAEYTMAQASQPKTKP